MSNLINNEYISSTRRYSKTLLMERQSDKDGFVSTQGLRSAFIAEFKRGKDRVLFNDRFYSRLNKKQHWRKLSVIFFTDRAIYRPSQKIYFKGIAINRSNYQAPKVLPNREVTVSLFNANNQKVETKKFTTDEFGSFHGSFTAPKSGRMGRMYIMSKSINGTKSIRVEEYKRAKFEVNFEPIGGEYSLGDRVTLIGKATALSGQGLADAKVRYRIKRIVNFPWLGWGVERPNFHPTL